MKSAWIIAGIAGAVLAAGLLTGCSGKAEEDSTTGPVQEQQSQQEEQQAEVSREKQQEQADQGAQGAEPQEIAQEKCPVMGLPINEDIYVDYKGRRIYFCCDGCDDKFLENPEKYLAKLDE